MAKHIIRYLLDGDNNVPSFVNCGGFYPNGEELVGLSIDDSKRHLPTSVFKLTKEQLITRILLVDRDDEGNVLSQQAAEDRADAFLSDMGLPDYV